MVYRILLFFLFPILTGCVVSPSGAVFTKQKPEGEEYLTTGVVVGVWKYDIQENRERLQKLMPTEDLENITEFSERYQVRVRTKYIPGIYQQAAEIVLLPKGWTYSLSAEPQVGSVVNLGDVVDIRARKRRHVDHLDSIRRKCNESPSEDERSDWELGCFGVDEFGWKGYAGKISV